MLKQKVVGKFTDIETFKILEGKLLTFIDATIQDSVQRKAQKDLVKVYLWDWFHHLEEKTHEYEQEDPSK